MSGRRSWPHRPALRRWLVTVVASLAAAAGLLTLACLTGRLRFALPVLVALVLLGLLSAVLAWFTFPADDDPHYLF